MRSREVQFITELEDAHKHLGSLIKEAMDSPDFDVSDLRVSLGHVLAHLHRAWYCRNKVDNLTDTEWEEARATPRDLEPLA